MMRFRAFTPLALGVCLLAGLMLPAIGLGAPSTTNHFEIEPGSFHFEPSSDQAGAHANWVTHFEFAHNAKGETYNDLRDTIVNVPVGFDASNTAVPTCSAGQLESLGPPKAFGSLCPPDSQVGTITLDLTLNTTKPVFMQFPVYNMEPTNYGTSAQLGFKTPATTQLLDISVRPSDLGLTALNPDDEELGEPHDVTVTVWGLPAAKEHDPERGEVCIPEGNPEVAECAAGGEEAGIAVKPFLSNPTSCVGVSASMEANSWEEPESWSRVPALGEVPGEVGPIVECGRVPFNPSLEVQPTTRSAESPTGLNVSLVVPQTWSNPYTIATSNLKETTVTLPEGITINPSAGSGLGSCSPAQYASETAESLPGAGCPPESKIGSIEIETPLLAETVPGAIYVATPYDNPFPEPEHPDGSLLALYVVAKDPARGILIKVAGRVALNPVTGQLTTTFGATPAFDGIPSTEGTPQQPFSKFTLKFRPGATAPLVSPAACGSYEAQGSLAPWSAPTEPRLVDSTPFETTLGVHEGPCPSGGVPPFKPQVISGTDNNDGGSYSPFYLRILREDGEQEITKFTTVLPPGLTGNLSGIPFCSEAQIEAARVATGAQEIEHPSCPAASEIGHTIVSAGVGTVLAQTPGKVYLAGPYHGSALSIVSVTSAKVGPFDLGTVVIRFALHINPLTAQAEVDSNGSDPIPHIIKGVVVHVREIRVYMDREKFILNPTNCDPMSITDMITGAGANPAVPADQAAVSVNTPFQAADCSSLQFKPSFKVSTAGKTSRRDGASLTVKLSYPNAPQGTQANIRSVKVDLPKQLPSRLTTLQKACTDSTFEANPAACPADSIVGHATANTPIVPVPLTGPAYFVSHGGAKFPELIIVLQGYGITLDLHGETFISKTGITSSTFRTVPDDPIGSFELTLPQGTDSALAANGDLCTSKLKMPTAFTAQNGAEIHQSTTIGVTGCPKHKNTKKTKPKNKNKKTTNKK